jgi:hypothetical protein
MLIGGSAAAAMLSSWQTAAPNRHASAHAAAIYEQPYLLDCVTAAIAVEPDHLAGFGRAANAAASGGKVLLSAAVACARL